MTIHDLTAFQRDLLVVISGLDGPNGLEIRGELTESYGEEIRHGRLYPSLDTLAEKGLIVKSEKDGRTNQYELTARGERELLDRLRWRTEHIDLPGPGVSSL
jgi:DNA-binding PadR family transcriptional regulator